MTDGSDLIAVVHVPKTAGSTLNAALRAAYGGGIEHIEAQLSKGQRVELESVPWISGHITIDGFRTRVEPLTQRKLRYLTSMRDPKAHVASHYNWLIEIGKRSKAFFDGHPKQIKQIHHEIAGSDNADPYAIISNLYRHAFLFMNCQSHYILGASKAAPSDQVDEKLARYDQIVTDVSMPDFLNALPTEISQTPLRENQSPYHFDKAVFDDPIVTAFLEEKNALDIRLYNRVLGA